MAENKYQSFSRKKSVQIAEIRNAPTIFQKCHLKEDIY